MRLEDENASAINVILPVQIYLKKYIASRSTQIKFIVAPSRLPEGRFANVTDVRRDAVDADGASDESAYLADGEVVWS